MYGNAAFPARLPPLSFSPQQIASVCETLEESGDIEGLQGFCGHSQEHRQRSKRSARWKACYARKLLSHTTREILEICITYWRIIVLAASPIASFK